LSGALLETTGLASGYGKRPVLENLSFRVFPGEIVLVIGSNGSGKSTLLKTLMGLLPVWAGQIHLYGTDVTAERSSSRFSHGIGYAPQGAPVFGALTVQRNLKVAGLRLSAAEMQRRIDAIELLFPELARRANDRAVELSGGMRQMLSLACALVPRPKLLMLDEPCTGLTPLLASRVLDYTRLLAREEQVGVIVVEHRLSQVARVVDRVCALKLGEMYFDGNPADLIGNTARLRSVFC
jgi:branched-chain amino acid transport system ATP-binding protein